MATSLLLLVILLTASSQALAGVVKRSDDRPPLEAVVEQLTADLQALQAKQSADIQSLQTKEAADIHRLDEALSATQAKLDALTTKVNRHVSFLVQLAQDGDNNIPAPPSGPYKFNKIILNDGNAYDSVTGVFTAPYAGVYLFALQIFVRGQQHALADIVVNNHPIIRMGVDSSADASDATSGIVKLRAGDKVWVQSGNGGHTVISDVHTFFAGNLLYTA